MKLILKMVLGFAIVARLLALLTSIQIFFIHEFDGDLLEIADSNVGEVQNAINIAYRVANIGSDPSKYLLESVSGRDGRFRAVASRFQRYFLFFAATYSG